MKIIALIPIMLALAGCVEKSTNPVSNGTDTLVVDWSNYFLTPHVDLNIRKGSLYTTVKEDSITRFTILSLDWPPQDSGLLKDLTWTYANMSYTRNSADTSLVYPQFIVVRYVVNSADTFADTVPLSTAVPYINSFRSQKDTSADSNLYTLTWDNSYLGSAIYSYMEIYIDNGIIGAEYYESYPNYCSCPENVGFEGYRKMYGRFEPEDNTFSFKSTQNLVPRIRAIKPVKLHQTHNLLACFKETPDLTIN